MFSKSNGKLNKRLFKVIESLLSIAVKYAKREADSYRRILLKISPTFPVYNVKITRSSASFMFRKG